MQVFISFNNFRHKPGIGFGFAGDVVEISDSEEEEVVILHPETPVKAPQ